MSTPSRLRLTKQDRYNIDVLCNFFDDKASPSKGKRSISFNQDSCMLLHKGFVYGLSRQSMFGVDKGGKHYQVTTIYVSSSNNGGKFTKTVWYELDENGLRHKLEKGFTHEEFHEKF